ncbi:MAG: aminoglycoside phosphotransferase family protein [Acidobacteriota bacterium]|nr:aminoglycoside phosphotransferase family protein [Acidobacteriota bacterium]
MQINYKELAGNLLETSPKSLELEPIRTGKHNTSFWVTAGPDRYVLRVAPPDDAGFLFYERLMMRQEPSIHGIIRAHTDIPAAEITTYDFSRKLVDRDMLLMRSLPGKPLSDARWLSPRRSADVLAQVGRYLSKLHTLQAANCLGLDEPQYGYLGAHRPMEPQSDWVSAFAVMWNKLIDDVVACDCYDQSEADMMRGLFQKHRALFDRPVDACLLHMDVWAQNILVDGEGRMTGLVDFDRALWGDVEIEYAVLDYCGISEPSFWEGYGKDRDHSDEAQVRKLFYLLYELQKYMPIRIWRRNNRTGAMGYKRQCMNLARQLADL